MAFLFKSKKSQDRGLASRDGTSGSQGSIQSANGSRIPRDEKTHRSTPTGSVNSIDHDVSPASPGQADQPGHGRRGGSNGEISYSSDLPLRQAPTNPNASLYPWSQRRLTYTSSHPSPFPRYGAAVNSVSSKEGDIYMMGGLINSSTVKGDLWMIEAGGNMACYPLATTSEGPGPRVGHSSLLVGNAFIVYGGDTKIDDSDVLDETLYLLNTSTRHWSRALPAGPRPSGRYGHSLNILGSKIFIFGGQVEGFFMNDLSAFDLNQLQMPNNKWEILQTGDSSAKTPAARTNHSMITYNDKMYLFGGTNGFQWFNDVWCYDPAVNKWSQLDCIGYIPAPREGHAAALVDDVMYVFGGRTEEGTDLGDLAAFRITSRRWYTFQNMGPSPSPRSGHSMTTVGKSVFVMGGEPSSATTTINDLGILYVLDTSKIRYPTDPGKGRRPSAGENGVPVRQTPSREGSNGPSENRRIMPASTNGQRSPSNGTEVGATASKLPRASPSPAGPPPQGPVPSKPTVDTSTLGRVRGASSERSAATASPQTGTNQSPISREVIPEVESPVMNGRRTPTQQAQVTRNIAAPQSEVPAPDTSKLKLMRPPQSQGSIDSTADPAVRNAPSATRPSSPPPPTRQPSNPLARRSSGRNSQTVALLKELDSARNRNAWYASELELARRAGYVSNTQNATSLDIKNMETFDEEDRPLIEALLAMRTELANVQSAVDQQAVLAAKQVAEAEKQRDAAIQEAIYAKAKAAGSQYGADQDTTDARSDGMSRKLATALHMQKDLQARLDTARNALEAERKARQLADDTVNATQRRMADLEAYKQQTSTEVERLKSELHLAQREARENSVASAEAVAAMELLRAEKEDFATKYNDVVGSSRDHNETFESLRNAIAASQDARTHIQNKLDEERTLREKAETKLTKLKAEHEARTAELVAVSQRLRDAEELAEKHAAEARTHRDAVLSGLNKLSARDGTRSGSGDAERIAALQNQIAAANELVKKYQQEADVAADRLRSAEERIAGLEQYQEQSSREGVGLRRQLQSVLRETQSLQAANTELKNKLAAQQLETNAMMVQHTALKDILSERGISPTTAIKARGVGSPRITSPADENRLRELESQLANAHAANEEAQQTFAIQSQEADSAYREKLTQLESDYQSAVHYVKGTEKMLKQLKEQLARYKAENGRLKSDMHDLEDRLQANGEKAAPSEDWESERNALQARITTLEAELRGSGAELQKSLDALKQDLESSRQQRDVALKQSEEATRKLSSHRKDLEQLQTENSLLEQRATDAEQKVSLLLDQVEHSVDNYRRQSRQVLPADGPSTNGTGNGGSYGHTRQESSEAGSVYGGNGVDGRNSAALDNLASELETLRSHWEATNKNYRLSTNFEFDSNAVRDKDSAGIGLSESLADWRKRLDHDEPGSTKTS
ncbi:hypothetical protein NLU13_0410 [Sarocladium strictum]|uniref:Uncharacterized protein n=1 Tax=Sarocladium strictum TaxID=5046 RepID=A0AA39GP09_SARSR|nr:hypothetical protein NLU13_0410 [Sarocladium strictum]